MIAPLLLLFSVTAAQPAEIEFREVLTLPPVGSGGRVPIHTNAVVAQLVQGTFSAPAEGSSVTSVDGQERTWAKETAGEDGTIQSRSLRGGFAFASVRSDSERVMILDAAGHSYVYVNGEPRGGDPYSYGFVRHPVLLRRGENAFLFNVGRGSLRAKLVPPPGEIYLETRDATLPDLIVGEGGEHWGAVMLTNATNQVWRGVSVTASITGGESATTEVGDVPPLIAIKAPFRFNSPKFSEPGKAELSLRLGQRNERLPVASTLTFELDIKPLHEIHKRTFVSEIDGSVQYYAVRPPFERNLSTADALVLTVHGAGVEATGQAAAYGAKSWCWIVAPTNRRPYGFDWEDWGRIDALEVLADAKGRYKPREDRIYLTGHSMGGHGAWYLGATHPDEWAAIGPAAGWINFWSYGGAVRYEDPDPIEAMLLRAANVSDTTKLLRNYLHHGVYVLHGAEDRTVPVAQARQMREILGAFHRDVDWHEEPGGGHWYDNTPEPGADCVDYGPMFDFFARRRRTLSTEARRIEFTTCSPSVSAQSGWVTIDQQIVPLEPSTIVATNPIGTRRFVIETTNVGSLSIDIETSPLHGTSGDVEVVIDSGEAFEAEVNAGHINLVKAESGWQATLAFNGLHKTPSRSGPFRSAFNNRFVLVYGTTGTPEENAWSYAKARYDAETWWYRGNGRAAVMPDRDFRGAHLINGPRGRILRTNAIVYGNLFSNSIIADVRGSRSVYVTRDAVHVGSRSLRGTELSILSLVPSSFEDPGFAPRLIAIVGGTGIVGMRSTDLMPYFVSGVHFPDLFIYDSRMHAIGSKAVRTAGFFGNDWSVENGDIAWRED